MFRVRGSLACTGAEVLQHRGIWPSRHGPVAPSAMLNTMSGRVSRSVRRRDQPRRRDDLMSLCQCVDYGLYCLRRRPIQPGFRLATRGLLRLFGVLLSCCTYKQLHPPLAFLACSYTGIVKCCQAIFGSTAQDNGFEPCWAPNLVYEGGPASRYQLRCNNCAISPENRFFRPRTHPHCWRAVVPGTAIQGLNDSATARESGGPCIRAPRFF